MRNGTELPFDPAPLAIGDSIFALSAELFPVHRSITGQGVRDTLRMLSPYVDIDVNEVPSGTQLFDWIVPPEWNIREAWIRNAAGESIVDSRESNLHVVGYSVPVHRVMPLSELRRHIHTLPDQPNLVPFRTSYYQRTWGFCMAHNVLRRLPEGLYEVLIDSRLEPGTMTYGEYLHRGEREEEVLFSTHVCHPSLANDNCSGIALLAHLAQWISSMRTRYSYRFLFQPAMFGTVAWLAMNEARARRVKHGLVLSCVGDEGGPSYMRTRRGDTKIDRIMENLVLHAGPNAEILDFTPSGRDERHWCSPGFNLAVGRFQRGRPETYPEHHTSADNLDFIKPQHLAASFRMLTAAIAILETDYRPINALPKGEPQLERRGLLATSSRPIHGHDQQQAVLWVLNLSDGGRTLLDIAEHAALPFDIVTSAAALLERHGLLKRLSP